MPKSRRDKPVALTKTKKHGRASKERLVDDIRECVQLYGSVYVFEVENMRNVKLKQLREEWGGSRFFLGKNRVMAHALGRDAHDEPREGSSKLTPFVTGQRGLLFTDTSKEDVLSYFSLFHDAHYARSGCIATADFSLDKGPLPADVAPHPLEPTLRKLGLPTRLSASVVELLQDTAVCRAGDVLTPEQCRLLQLFDQKQAAFRIHLIAALTYSTGEEGKTRAQLEVMRDDAAAQADDESADAAMAAPAAVGDRQRRRKEQSERAGRAASMRVGREEEEEAETDGAAGQDAQEQAGEEDEEEESEEFVPEPLQEWGEVEVPTYT